MLGELVDSKALSLHKTLVSLADDIEQCNFSGWSLSDGTRSLVHEKTGASLNFKYVNPMLWLGGVWIINCNITPQARVMACALLDGPLMSVGPNGSHE